jgi:hypothetical protein
MGNADVIVREKMRGYARDKMIIAWLLEHEMHMTRSPRMSPKQPQHLPHRSIIRNAIRHGHNRFKPKHALVITTYHGPPIRLFPAVVLVLHVVHTLTVRFPYIDLGVVYRRAGRGLDGAQAEQWLAFRVGADAGPGGSVLGIVCVVGTEDRAFGGGGGFGVVDGVYEEGETEGVGEEDEFLEVAR